MIIKSLSKKPYTPNVFIKSLVVFVVAFTASGCSTSPLYVNESKNLQPGLLPTPDMSLSIPNLRPCTHTPESELHINSNYPVTVLVHGCKASAGNFQSLAQLYAFHGQQAICFSYDDRDSLVDSADKLSTALHALVSQTANPELSVIGHSMGGLVARKAMELNQQYKWQGTDVRLELITVSAPLAGISIANTCGYPALNWLSLGIVPAICWGITGDNWNEITFSSDFISHPQPLLPAVNRYLKVVTNEKNTCRRLDNAGSCIESDYVFELDEQYHPLIDHYSQVTNVQVDAGHVAIVGYKDVAPYKLLEILQQQGILPATPIARRDALNKLIARLY